MSSSEAKSLSVLPNATKLLSPDCTLSLTLLGHELTFCSIFRTWPYNGDNDNKDNDKDNDNVEDDDAVVVVVVVVIWPNGGRTTAIARAHPGMFGNASWVC